MKTAFKLSLADAQSQMEMFGLFPPIQLTLDISKSKFIPNY